MYPNRVAVGYGGKPHGRESAISADSSRFCRKCFNRGILGHLMRNCRVGEQHDRSTRPQSGALCTTRTNMKPSNVGVNEATTARAEASAITTPTATIAAAASVTLTTTTVRNTINGLQIKQNSANVDAPSSTAPSNKFRSTNHNRLDDNTGKGHARHLSGWA